MRKETQSAEVLSAAIKKVPVRAAQLGWKSQSLVWHTILHFGKSWEGSPARKLPGNGNSSETSPGLAEHPSSPPRCGMVWVWGWHRKGDGTVCLRPKFELSGFLGGWRNEEMESPSLKTFKNFQDMALENTWGWDNPEAFPIPEDSVIPRNGESANKQNCHPLQPSLSITPPQQLCLCPSLSLSGILSLNPGNCWLTAQGFLCYGNS